MINGKSNTRDQESVFGLYIDSLLLNARPTGISKVTIELAKNFALKGGKLISVDFLGRVHCVDPVKLLAWAAQRIEPSVTPKSTRYRRKLRDLNFVNYLFFSNFFIIGFDLLNFIKTKRIIRKFNMSKPINISTIVFPEAIQNRWLFRSVAKTSNTNRKILICHDVLLFTHPEWFTKVAARRREIVLSNYQLANEIICVSRETEKQLTKSSLLSSIILKKRIKVVPLGSTIEPSLTENRIVGEQFSTMYVSSLQPRKNHLLFLEALEVASKGHSTVLHLVAGDSWKSEAIMAAIEAKQGKWLKIVIHRNLSENELVELYREVDFTCYLPLEEGFGLPILESLSQGTPVICSNVSSMKEFSQLKGVIQVDPRNREEMSNKFLQIFLGEVSLDDIRLTINPFLTRRISDFGDEVWNHVIS